MKFQKELLQAVVCNDTDEAELIAEEITDTSRWSVHYRAVFKYQDKFYSATYSIGATEMQDERPFEYDPCMVECPEVVPVERVVTVYEVKEG